MVGGTATSDNIVHRMAMEDPLPWYQKKNLRMLYFLLFPCVIGIEMTSGFDSQIINTAQISPYWKKYFGNPSGAYKGILSASLPLGACIGLPFIPWVNDRFGRRWCIMIGSIIMIIGALLQTFSVNGAMYTVARCIIGFGLPYAIVAGSCLIGELAYPKERPIMGSMFNACYFIGSIIAAGVSYGTQVIPNDWSWRVPALLQITPSLLQVIFVLFLPESPRWLVFKDRNEEALAVLVRFHAEGDENSDFVRAEMAEIRTTIALEAENAKRSWFDMIRTAGARRRTIIGSLLGLFTQLSGNVVISYYLGDSLKLMGYTDPNFQSAYNLGNTAWNLVSAVAIALSVMRFKRRTLYLTGITGILIVYVSWTICAAMFNQNKDTSAARASLFFIYAYTPFYNIAFNAPTYTYLVEVFPFATRARGVTIFQFFGKMSQFFGTFVNPLGFDGIGWKYLLVYCVWIFVEGVLIFFLWPETAGRTLEELAFLFEPDELDHQRTAAVEKTIHHEDNMVSETAEHSAPDTKAVARETV